MTSWKALRLTGLLGVVIVGVIVAGLFFSTNRSSIPVRTPYGPQLISRAMIPIKYPMWSMGFDDTGKYLFVFQTDPSAFRIFDGRSGQFITEVDPGAEIFYANTTSRSNELICVTHEHGAFLVDLKTKKSTKVMEGRNKYEMRACFSPSQGALCVISGGPAQGFSVRLVDVETHEDREVDLGTERKHIAQLNGEILIATQDGRLGLVRRETTVRHRELRIPDTAYFDDVVTTFDRPWIVLSDRFGSRFTYEVSEDVKLISRSDSLPREIRHMAGYHDGRFLVSGGNLNCEPGFLALIDRNSVGKIREIPSSHPVFLSYAPSHKTIAVSGPDFIHLCDANQLEP